MKVLWSSKVFCTSNYVSFLILDSLEKKKNYNSGLSLRFQVSRYIQPVGRKATNRDFWGFYFSSIFVMQVAGGHLHGSQGNPPTTALRFQLHIKTYRAV